VKALKPFTCPDAIDGSCDSLYYISGREYTRVEAYTNSIQDVLNVYPSVEHLLECKLVKEAFSEVLFNHCKPLKKFAEMVWLGMLFLAVFMVLLILLWTIKTRHEHRYNLSDGSVEPHFAPTKALESGTVKEIVIWQHLNLSIVNCFIKDLIQKKLGTGYWNANAQAASDTTVVACT